MLPEKEYVAINRCYVNIPVDEPEGSWTTLLLESGGTVKMPQDWAASLVENGDLRPAK